MWIAESSAWLLGILGIMLAWGISECFAAPVLHSTSKPPELPVCICETGAVRTAGILPGGNG